MLHIVLLHFSTNVKLHSLHTYVVLCKIVEQNISVQSLGDTIKVNHCTDGQPMKLYKTHALRSGGGNWESNGTIQRTTSMYVHMKHFLLMVQCASLQTRAADVTCSLAITELVSFGIGVLPTYIHCKIKSNQNDTVQHVPAYHLVCFSALWLN